MTDTITEGKARISVPDGVFYNPEMKFCRDLSVLVVRAALAGKKARTVDATAGTGIRGIRYAKEGADAVGELFLVDMNKAAAKSVRANVKANKVKAKVVKSSFAKFANSPLAYGGFGLIELDPFGSPVPLIYDACRVSRNGTLLSVTATDTAVLCGAHPKACVKNYQAKPLNPFLCHEVGARILLGKIVRTASEFNLGIKPLLTLSHLHYFKVFVLLEEGAEEAVASVKGLGLLAHCDKCLERMWRKGVAASLPEKCPRCGETMEHAGPLWLGELHDKKALARIAKLGKKDDKVAKMAGLLLGECGMPPFYFELHRLCERLRINAARPDRVVAELKKRGFKVSRTHFQPNAIKTDAGIREVEAAARKAAKL